MNQFSNRFLRNISTNTASYLVQVVTVFFMSPFIVSSLGKEIYGVWSLLISLTGYMSMVDMGVRVTTGRYLNFYLGKNQIDKAGQSVAASYAIYTLLSVIVLGASLVIAWIFPQIFPKTPLHYLPEIRIAIPLLALSIWLSFYNATDTQLLVAAHRYDLCSASAIMTSLIRAGVIVTVLKLGYGMVGLAIVQVSLQLLQWLQIRFWAKRYGAQVKIKIRDITRETVKELFSFGGWSFVRITAVNLLSYTGSVLVGVFLGATAVAYFSIGLMFVDYANNLVGQVTSVTNPEFSQRAGANDKESLLNLLYRVTRISAFISIPLYLGIVYLSGGFINLWMGPGFHPSAQVAIILASIALLSRCGSAISMTLWALGEVKVMALIEWVKLGVSLILYFLFVKVFNMGLMGMALGTLGPALLDTFWIPYYTAKTLKTRSWSLYWESLFRPGFFVFGAVIALEIFKHYNLLSFHSWLGFVGMGSVFTLIIVGLSLPLVLGKDLSQSLLGKIPFLNKVKIPGLFGIR